VATKTQRQSTILRLVRAHRVTSQEMLRELLADEGFEVAQGTLSRDIREMGIVKVPDDEGGSAYNVPADVVDPSPNLGRLLPALFVGLDGVDNLLVLHTLTGGAQPVAVALDHQEWDEIIGTIGGDDTILIILRDKNLRDTVVQRLRALAGLGPGDDG
jgi:transcriptional regulator of arginine metabolism